MSQSRFWCFTLNNYTEDDIERIQQQAQSDSTTFVGYGKEVGQSGTPHLQGYIVFEKKKRFNVVRRLLGGVAHIERKSANSTHEQAWQYCCKDGDIWQDGELPPEKGSRTDLDAIDSAVRSGKRPRDIAEQFGTSFIKFHRGIERLHFRLDEPRRWASEVFVYWGASGTGKTRKVVESEPDLWISGGGGWFDGYEGQEAVLFDDFGGHEFKFTFWLKLVDRYPMRVQIKGGYTQWKPKRIFFTSNFHYTEWWKELNLAQLEARDRRIHHVLAFNALNEDPVVEK